MGPGLRGHLTLGLLLDPIVAHGCGGVGRPVQIVLADVAMGLSGSVVAWLNQTPA